MWSIVLRVLIAATVTSLTFAAPAAADEEEYLHGLRETYVFLSTEELLSEGIKVCKAVRSGMTSSNAAIMVQRDLRVSVPTAGNIVAAAVVQLDC